MTAVQSQPVASAGDTLGIMLRVAIVVLTLSTAYIHSTLGGMIFTANAVGYTVFAVLMVVPIAIVSRYRWVVRAGLVGFALGSIFAWVFMGGRFTLAYVDKAIEVGLIAALLVEMWRYDGGPINVLRKLIALAITIVRMPFGGRGQA
jgi:hypothetical protein